jgi:hypothetical protein
MRHPHRCGFYFFDYEDQEHQDQEHHYHKKLKFPGGPKSAKETKAFLVDKTNEEDEKKGTSA